MGLTISDIGDGLQYSLLHTHGRMSPSSLACMGTVSLVLTCGVDGVSIWLQVFSATETSFFSCCVFHPRLWLSPLLLALLLPLWVGVMFCSYGSSQSVTSVGPLASLLTLTRTGTYLKFCLDRFLVCPWIGDILPFGSTKVSVWNTYGSVDMVS